MRMVNLWSKTTSPSPDPAGSKQKDPKAAAPKKDDEISLKKEDVEKLFEHLKAVDGALRDRLFILKVAVEDGWTTAKDVAFYKTGETVFARRE